MAQKMVIELVKSVLKLGQLYLCMQSMLYYIFYFNILIRKKCGPEFQHLRNDYRTLENAEVDIFYKKIIFILYLLFTIRKQFDVAWTFTVCYYKIQFNAI